MTHQHENEPSNTWEFGLSESENEQVSFPRDLSELSDAELLDRIDTLAELLETGLRQDRTAHPRMTWQIHVHTLRLIAEVGRRSLPASIEEREE